MIKVIYLAIALQIGLMAATALAITNENQNDAMQVESGDVEYNGQEIILTGSVSVLHSLGKITANRFSFSPPFGKDKNSKSSLLGMEGLVNIQLQDGGQLRCQYVQIDYNRLTGTFSGNAIDQDVIYRHEGNGAHHFALEIKSLQASVILTREQTEAQTRPKILLQQLQGDGNVRLNYDNQYFVSADQAIYQRLSSSNEATVGSLQLKTYLPTTLCKMSNRQGDFIEAPIVDIDTNERMLRLTQPIGQFSFLQDGNIGNKIVDFSADQLIFDDHSHSLRLQGNVKLNEKEFFNLKTEHELVISAQQNSGKRQLKSIQAPQKIFLSYDADPKKGGENRIYCPGPLFIDHALHEVFLYGELINDAELPSKNNQVRLENAFGEMYADTMHFFYKWQDQNMSVDEIILEGNVRVFNRFDGHLNEAGSILHYALADKINFFPTRLELFLSASGDKRVLFLDKVNQLRISAPALQVYRDQVSNKEVIHGQGDVRFTFMDRENARFKECFKDVD